MDGIRTITGDEPGAGRAGEGIRLVMSPLRWASEALHIPRGRRVETADLPRALDLDDEVAGTAAG
jgi:hypothetical protein